MKSLICIITSNPGKLKEFKELLPSENLVLPKDLDLDISGIVESGKTYLENALLKLHFPKENVKSCLLADDSGLEVDCLDGRPGLHSARYGGENISSEERYKKLLIEISEKGFELPVKGKFVCVLAFKDQNGKVTTFDGHCPGVINQTKTGNTGFGYDPIFFPNSQFAKGKSFAELTSEIKNKISHRGIASQKLIKFLRTEC